MGIEENVSDGESYPESEQLSISESINKLTEYGLKESTLEKLYDYSCDIADEAIIGRSIHSSDYKSIGSVIKEFHEMFLSSVCVMIDKLTEKNYHASDNIVLDASEKIRDSAIAYLKEMNNNADEQYS